MKRKIKRKNFVAKYRKLKKADKIKKSTDEIADTFLDEDSKLVVEDAFVSQPSYDEVREVVSECDGYRDYVSRESGNGLTFGDY